MIKTSPFRTSEQVGRCNCHSNDYPVLNTVNNGHDGKNLKPCQSPLVIISVFPKHDNNLADFVQTVQCAQIDNKRSVIPENIITKSPKTETEMSKIKNTTKSTRSRSPSPKDQKTKSKTIKTDARNESPQRSKFDKKDLKKGTNFPKQTLQFFNSNTKKEGSNKKRKTSPPRSPRAKTPPPTPSKKEPQKRNASRQCLKSKARSTKGKVDIGINTEHLKTKKALVDSYTNKITEQMKSNKENPDKSVSIVSVNIDSENEYYDMSFRQNKFTTDFKVRKTMKEASAQKSLDENQEAQKSLDENQERGSMENFFPNMSKKHGRATACQRSTCEKLNVSVLDKKNLITYLAILTLYIIALSRAFQSQQTQSLFLTELP